jgi:hypothetical protein
MTLKTTLLMGDPIVTCNALVSCVTSLNEKLHPLIISTSIGVCFFTKANLRCHANSLLMQHANALE